jgi:hypothetical protein
MMTMKKMTKTEIYELKKKHRLERVMQEAGEAFEADPKNSELWQSTITPGLVVDLRRQSWEINAPGMDKKTGDVIDWLKLRYSWNFGQIIKYLSRRPRDPKRKDPPQAAKQEHVPQIVNVGDDLQPVDDLQRRALNLAGDRIKDYFSWPFWKLVLYLRSVRIEAMQAPDFFHTHCDRCEELLNWEGEAKKHLERIPVQFDYSLQYVGELPIIAYAIKHRVRLEDVGRLKGNDAITEAINQIVDELENVYVEEEDGIVCRSCAWREYNFQNALVLVMRSAARREHEAGQGSAAQRDTAAGKKIT